MTDLPWSKFFWSDWTSDEALKQCSLAAQGLWMRMLCICATGDPIGYLTIKGNPLDAKGVAISAGVPMGEAESLMAELELWGVFSRDRSGRIYSRRIVRDAAISAKARKNGKMGGNPSLGNQKENHQSLKGLDKGEDKTQKPEARVQIEKEEPTGSSKKRGERLPRDWLPSPAFIDAARELGLDDQETQREADKFRDYWIGKTGKDAAKLDWLATWRNWCRSYRERNARRNVGRSSPHDTLFAGFQGAAGRYTG